MSPPPGWVQHLDKLHLLTPLRILLVVVVAVIATLLIRGLVSRLLRKALVRVVGIDDPRSEARRKALTSSLHAAMVGVVWTLAVITVVSQLGINIGAFIAVATVVGGAIGFGAQVLVRDVIAGFFVLADDQYGPGDTVDLGHAVGVVERVTLRTARVRDGEGNVWHVSHGNVARVGNMSKSPSGPLDVDVARTMSIPSLTAAVSGLVAELVADTNTAVLLTSVPIIVGVIDVRDDRIVFRVTAHVQPANIDEVRRAWRILTLGAFADGRLAAPEPHSGVVHVHQPTEPQ